MGHERPPCLLRERPPCLSRERPLCPARERPPWQEMPANSARNRRYHFDDVRRRHWWGRERPFHFLEALEARPRKPVLFFRGSGGGTANVCFIFQVPGARPRTSGLARARHVFHNFKNACVLQCKFLSFCLFCGPLRVLGP